MWQVQAVWAMAAIAMHGEGNSTRLAFGCCMEHQFHRPVDRVLSACGVPWDPKGGELYQSTVKPWETEVEAGRCSDVQIV